MSRTLSNAPKDIAARAASLVKKFEKQREADLQHSIDAKLKARGTTAERYASLTEAELAFCCQSVIESDRHSEIVYELLRRLQIISDSRTLNIGRLDSINAQFGNIMTVRHLTTLEEKVRHLIAVAQKADPKGEISDAIRAEEMEEQHKRLAIINHG